MAASRKNRQKATRPSSNRTDAAQDQCVYRIAVKETQTKNVTPVVCNRRASHHLVDIGDVARRYLRLLLRIGTKEVPHVGIHHVWVHAVVWMLRIQDIGLIRG